MKGEPTSMVTGRTSVTRGRQVLAVVAIAVGALLVGCGDDDVDTQATEDTIEQRSNEAREEAEQAFATLRTNGERILDEIQTRNAPELKERLLDECRDALERLRRAESDRAPSVEALCDRIRDTDPNDAGMWREVKDEIEKLREG